MNINCTVGRREAGGEAEKDAAEGERRGVYPRTWLLHSAPAQLNLRLDGGWVGSLHLAHPLNGHMIAVERHPHASRWRCLLHVGTWLLRKPLEHRSESSVAPLSSLSSSPFTSFLIILIIPHPHPHPPLPPPRVEPSPTVPPPRARIHLRLCAHARIPRAAVLHRPFQHLQAPVSSGDAHFLPSHWQSCSRAHCSASVCPCGEIATFISFHGQSCLLTRPLQHLQLPAHGGACRLIPWAAVLPHPLQHLKVPAP